MDRHSVKQRSYNMSQVKSENTKPELYVFAALKKLNLKFKKHYDVLGKPDIAFPKLKIAVFIDGEFWHGRRFKKERETYKQFWIKKIEGNIKRDRKNRALLKKEGWKVIRIWDMDLKKNPEKEMAKIISTVNEATLN